MPKKWPWYNRIQPYQILQNLTLAKWETSRQKLIRRQKDTITTTPSNLTNAELIMQTIWYTKNLCLKYYKFQKLKYVQIPTSTTHKTICPVGMKIHKLSIRQIVNRGGDKCRTNNMQNRHTTNYFYSKYGKTLYIIMYCTTVAQLQWLRLKDIND